MKKYLRSHLKKIRTTLHLRANIKLSQLELYLSFSCGVFGGVFLWLIPSSQENELKDQQ